MSRYDGLIIPRSYSEYLNKTDSATLSQMLQHLTGLWSHAVSSGDNKPVTSDAVYEALSGLTVYSYLSKRSLSKFDEIQAKEKFYVQMVDRSSKGTFPQNANSGVILTFTWDSPYATQIFIEIDTQRRIYIRYNDNGTPGTWKQLAFI